MATLLLAGLGSAIGGATGIGWLATLGQAAGAVAGAVIDQSIINMLSPGASAEGGRLTNVNISGSTEGASITRLVGRSRLGGQMIWATRYEEQKETEEQGGKGGGGVKTTTYTYFANFAVAFCEGPVARIGRLWADGREIDQQAATIRKYLGTETQAADSLIESKERGNAPAYRGIAYVVFERLDLSEYGNRMPSVTAEIFRAEGDLEPMIQAVTLIPGSTEFGYEPTQVNQVLGKGSARTENRHTLVTQSDITASLDQLQQLAPECRSVSLVVAWFGNDLRAGNCSIQPKVEIANKNTAKEGGGNYAWTVAGLTRKTALVISQVDGKPAFGGSPNDASVIACIREMKRRGFRVTLYPFIMMDVPGGNTLPDPYSDNAARIGQPVYPWRGRITISPAPGFSGSPDKTAAAGAQISAFVGSAQVSHFSSSSGATVRYTGPAQWSYRRFILHMAKLCQLAGGVDSFFLGSEMVALTTSRSAAATYPFVDALMALAADVRTMLPAIKISYAADWSEYHSHRPTDGSGDVYFHLDPLWANPAIDMVAIDNYMPLADWRDGSDHLDYKPDGPTTIYDRAYLKANIESGEYFDWFYASEADRISQKRTPITDGAGKPWIYRNKDIRSWWLNRHFNRPGGIESGAATAWVPQSKPIWFSEIGCPAIDKGANQPNVFFDPKSSESFVPYFSSGERDDAMQRAFLEAALGYWSDPSKNPPSGVYAGRMVDTSSIFLWTWDARPGPSFPQDDEMWADASNWQFGHWLSGRLGSAPARETLTALMNDFSFRDYAVADIGAVVDGVVIDDATTARSAFENISTAYLAYAIESEGLIKFRSRLGEPVRAEYGLDELTDGGDNGEPLTKTRQQETDLPREVKVSYSEPTNDDQPASVSERRLTGQALGKRDVSLPAVMPETWARRVAQTVLHDAWASRESAEFGLGPSELVLDAGDIVSVTWPTPETWRLSEIADGDARKMKAARVETDLYSGGGGFPARHRGTVSVPALSPPAVLYIDGPMLADEHVDYRGYIAAFSNPWPGGTAFYRSPATSGYTLDSVLPVAATMGELAFDFWAGPTARWDRVSQLWVNMYTGTLSSVTELQALGGANAIAVQNMDGEWEVLTFATATLWNPGQYRLTDLLRGLRGTEHAMRSPVAAGAPVIMLNTAMRQPDIKPEHVDAPLNWRAGPSKRDVSDPSYVESQEIFHGKGRRPYSPGHLKSVWLSNGDIRLSWIRRTRIGGENDWLDGVADVPLGETSEAYEIEILEGTALPMKRTVTGIDKPEWVYTTAHQIADFGAPLTSIRWRVYQMSSTFGRGVGAEYP
ncbi:baseplate multidomain protein megatron [Phyllobacterium leguminum]|uniref:Putative tail protein n=1 Tax=Phyllobacterium leguminum TaxID=314237 RepID=A0A318SZP1_9HYPH|nr:glycoside hydrolase/phage tail family protein [Phyllobacterium leguminum]PYE86924.1 putative tail protein [Phyllobacterium leguminum]